MNSCLVKLCIFLFLTVAGTQGLELTINVRKNDTVTLVCSSSEDLKKCYCPLYPQNCQKCTDVTTLADPFETYSEEKYFVFSGLKYSNSGLYVCSSSYQKIGRRYRLNVVDDHQDPTVVIGAVGETTVMSCGTELDIMAASEKHWCRLSSANACQSDTVMGPENDARGDFKILDNNRSFSLEKRHLTLNDTGFYRFTQTIQNQTKVCEVDLQVKDKPNFLQIGPVHVNEHLKITCQYSQDLKEFSKSWLCDKSDCGETVKSVDERSQSALVLTVDHVACSKITSFQCVARMPYRYAKSNVHLNPLKQNPIVDVAISSFRNIRKVTVQAYSQLNLICFKPDRYSWDYDRYHMGRWGMDDFYHQVTPKWCKVINNQCVQVEENTRETRNTVTLQICVTPNDHGTKYRCPISRWSTDVEILVSAPPPPSPPRTVTPATKPKIPDTSDTTKYNVGIIIVVTGLILLIILLCLTVTTFKGRKLRQRLFARRTPLSAVDVHANMYANSVANYYNHNRHQVLQPDKQGEGDDKETSSSLDDEFEELPVAPKMSSSVTPEETDYVRVKPGGAAWSQNVDALQRDSEQFGQGGLPLRSYGHVSGLGGKGEVGYMSKKVLKKQFEDAAQSSSGRSNNEDDDEVTYTHVTIKPKARK